MKPLTPHEHHQNIGIKHDPTCEVCNPPPKPKPRAQVKHRPTPKPKPKPEPKTPRWVLEKREAVRRRKAAIAKRGW